MLLLNSIALTLTDINRGINFGLLHPISWQLNNLCEGFHCRMKWNSNSCHSVIYFFINSVIFWSKKCQKKAPKIKSSNMHQIQKLKDSSFLIAENSEKKSYSPHFRS